MPLAMSPDQRCSTQPCVPQPFRVVSFAIDPADGQLKQLGEAALADSMANIDVDRSGRCLLRASYGGNRSPSTRSTRTASSARSQQTDADGSERARDPRRRGQPLLFATCLGGDILLGLALRCRAPARSSAERAGAGHVDARSGPRHFVWDPVPAHRLPAQRARRLARRARLRRRARQMREVQARPPLPPGFAGKPWAADLHLTPDGRFLYACERRSSTIAATRSTPSSGHLKTLATCRPKRRRAASPSILPAAG